MSRLPDSSEEPDSGWLRDIGPNAFGKLSAEDLEVGTSTVLKLRIFSYDSFGRLKSTAAETLGDAHPPTSPFLAT